MARTSQPFVWQALLRVDGERILWPALMRSKPFCCGIGRLRKSAILRGDPGAAKFARVARNAIDTWPGRAVILIGAKDLRILTFDTITEILRRIYPDSFRLRSSEGKRAHGDLQGAP